MKNTDIQKKIDHFLLPYVNKPGRYIGNELNLVEKDLNQTGFRYAIAFPEVYEIAMSSLATGILYHLLNRLDYVYAERVFAPWTDAEQIMRENSIPLYSLETFTPLRDFDVVGFTLQYELTYTNVLNMLDLAGIPLWSRDRDEDDPIIMAGGPCTCNPEPMAEFIDAYYIGDAESGIEEVCQTLALAKKEGVSRTEKLRRIGALRGVYIPGFYQPERPAESRFARLVPVDKATPPSVKTQIISGLKNDFYPEAPIVPLIEVTHNRLPVEIMRGCTEGCRFCNAGMIYRPTRERDEDDIVDYTRRAIGSTGFEEVSFLSLSVSDYSSLNNLMRKEKQALQGTQVNISFPSMRLDSFSEEIAEFASSVRKSGFTFAPEAGSARLRRVINKNISDEDLIKAVTIALDNGWKTLKFYFMIGLPTETKEDIHSIAQLVIRVLKISKRYGHIQFHVSISPFSPKSHTPFQWEKQDTKEEILAKVGVLQDAFRSIKQVKFTWRDPKVSEIECILGRGDREIAKVIYTAWQKGTKFDGWSDMFRYDTWLDALHENGINREDYLGQIGETDFLPWDHIDKGVTRNFLRRERKNAYQENITIDCKDGTCFGCGIQRKDSFRQYAECYQELQLHSAKSEHKIFKKPYEESKSSEPVKQPAVKFRLHFVKRNYARYLSHLDLLRIFERAFRRAKIQVAYSEGFNPRPKFSFGPALSLGHSSDAEYFDTEFHGLTQPEEILAINRFLPDGMEVLEAKQVTEKIPPLSKSINSFDYQVNLSGKKINPEDVTRLLKTKSLIVDRTNKGKTRQIDIRPYLDEVLVQDDQLHIRTNIIDGRTARVDEITSFLFGSQSAEYKYLPILRRRQLIKEKSTLRTPMDF